MLRLEKTTPCPMNALSKAKRPDRASKDDTNQHSRYTDAQPIDQPDTQPVAQPVAQPHSCSQHGGCQPEVRRCNCSEPGNQTVLQERTHSSLAYRRARPVMQEFLKDPETESTPDPENTTHSQPVA